MENFYKVFFDLFLVHENFERQHLMCTWIVNEKDSSIFKSFVNFCNKIMERFLAISFLGEFSGTPTYYPLEKFGTKILIRIIEKFELQSF